MVSDKVRLDYVLVSVLALLMVIILLVSGLFYFSLISGGALFNAKVVYNNHEQTFDIKNAVENVSLSLTNNSNANLSSVVK